MKTMKVLGLGLFLMLGLQMSAQPAPPSSDNTAPIPGLAILAAAGAALGIKKVHDSKKDA
ncbi:MULTISPECIES: hypothetical protein [Croceimicrobium]|uniref:PEP-CTERM sorting domain-containing protein n=1 Tax=Croceimicrobium hydrocarbonivorans TaxID=2761580 RepID=A0A7H0VE90_9FLAO|nr:hypothetical protein [Croceimicrobium hydrocarbonivorans]QNR24038.1 hypothetical protein H4K34_16950 [Croceimicrobium hydrocarbonivorans]